MECKDIVNMANLQANAIKVIQKYIQENPLYLSSPKYKETLVAHAIRELEKNIEDSSVPFSLLASIDKELMDAISDPEVKYIKSKMKSARMKILKFSASSALEIYLSLNSIKRSELLSKFKATTSPDKEVIKDTIEYVRNKPQPPQRTPAWYEFRNNLITASNAWKALKSKSSRAQLVSEKCKEIDMSKYDTSNVNTNTAFHHGTKYEEISVMFYEYTYKTKVEDFGCLRHDLYHCLGASPDGINTCIESPLYGRMLEIKNPVSREITGIPKEDYWIQMQLQMEVCNLDTCDFLETLIKEYDDEDAFITDSYHTCETSSTGEILTPFTHTAKGQLKGIIMYFSSSSGPIYEYMPLYSSQEDFEKWSNIMFEKHQNVTWLKNIYWYMKEYSCVVVERNRSWFKHAIHMIEDTWKQIVDTRKKGVGKANPVTTRPKTRSRSNSTIEDFHLSVPPSITGCLLNLDDGDCVSVVVEEVGRQHSLSPITTTIDVMVESKKEDESVSQEVEVNLMSDEDKMSTIRDVLFSLLESCEEVIKINEENKINKIMATTQTSSKEKKKTGSPVTRSSTAAKSKKERKDKKKDDNVIYVIT